MVTEQVRMLSLKTIYFTQNNVCMEWYYILGAISYGIFIIQFILSNFGFSETDLDVDFDGEVDFSVNDLLSFKGLVHFAMGFSGWLMLSGKVTALTISFACGVGIIFMVILYFVYKLCMKFNSEPTTKSKTDLVGEVVIVYVPLPNGNCVCKVDAPNYTEITCKADTEVKVGDILTIKSYKDGVYYISK